MKIGLVLVPTPDWWRERPVGTSTNAGWKVLIGEFLKYILLMNQFTNDGVTYHTKS